jgi:hypothetical protein
MLGVVRFVAVVLAALREATDVWDCGVFAVVSLSLLTAILMAVQSQGRKRSFWLGFNLFGWAYLIANLIPTIEARLPTTRGLAYLGSWKADRAKVWEDDLILQGVRSLDTKAKDWASPGPSNVVLLVDGSASLSQTNASLLNLNLIVAPPGGTPENFVRIGHSLLALVMGIFGAWLSRWLHDNRPATVPRAPASGPGDPG